MSNGDAVEQLISDIRALRLRLGENSSDENRADICAYILSNRPIIDECIEFASILGSESRGNLAMSNRELDDSTIPDGFWSGIVADILQYISQYYLHGARNISEDNLHMIIRALAYGKYCDTPLGECRLLLSPIT